MISLLPDGASAFRRLRERIREAKRSIECAVFIWRNDELGALIACDLLDAAKRGVSVRIVKDRLGWAFERAEENKSGMLHTGTLSLWPAWCAVSIFYGSRMQRPSVPPDVIGLLLRHKNVTIDTRVRKDHAKYYIFDDKILITGGMNIEQKHVTTDLRGLIWRDYMVEVDDIATIKRLRSRLEGTAPFDDKKRIDFIRNDFAQRRYEIEPVFGTLLANAKRSVRIEMAYIGENSITGTLVRLAKEGKTITILIPGDANLQDDYNKRTAKRLIIRSGGLIRIALCKDMLHAKAMIIDDRIALIGSANLNRQALRVVGELDVYCTEKRFVSALRKSFEQHLKDAQAIKRPEELRYSATKAQFESFAC